MGPDTGKNFRKLQWIRDRLALKTMTFGAAQILRSLLVLGHLIGLVGNVAPAFPKDVPLNDSWNPKAAAEYLDRRADWWMNWPGAARDHGTFCVSCHTLAAYAFARPGLRPALGETVVSAKERRYLDNIVTRVRLWKEIAPFYDGRNAARSRGTESVLNALILARNDLEKRDLSEDTRAAFANMWALQQTSGNSKGAWEWIQFDNEPWEAHDSEYYGAALGALAAGSVTGAYRPDPEIQSRLEWLSQYLNRDFAKQSPINQAVVLWASAKWPTLLTQERRTALVYDLERDQQADGGWSLASLVWTWRDWSFKSLAKLWMRSESTPTNPKSDGYATGLITVALEQCGFSSRDTHVARSRAWLIRNQDKTGGQWPAYSPNGKRDRSTGEGLFMTDAATAYAVLALTTR